jgi:hypothetical protein
MATPLDVGLKKEILDFLYEIGEGKLDKDWLKWTAKRLWKGLKGKKRGRPKGWRKKRVDIVKNPWDNTSSTTKNQ